MKNNFEIKKLGWQYYKTRQNFIYHDKQLNLWFYIYFYGNYEYNGVSRYRWNAYQQLLSVCERYQVPVPWPNEFEYRDTLEVKIIERNVEL
jgi:hypothetical protein